MSNRTDRFADLDAAMAARVASGAPEALAYAVVVDDEVHAGAAGSLPDGSPVGGDTIFRISSMTKPVTAVATLTMVEDGTLALDQPVDDLLPELADRVVLVPGATELDQVVPAERAITVEDLLTFRLGLGMDFTNFGNQLTLNALADRGFPS